MAFNTEPWTAVSLISYELQFANELKVWSGFFHQTGWHALGMATNKNFPLPLD